MNATAAPADQSLHLVAPGGVGEAVQRGAVEGCTCDGRLTAASLGYCLVVGAICGIRGCAAQHMSGNGFELRLVRLFQMLFELLLRPKLLCPLATPESAEDVGPQPARIGCCQGLVGRNGGMLAQPSVGQLLSDRDAYVSVRQGPCLSMATTTMLAYIID